MRGDRSKSKEKVVGLLNQKEKVEEPKKKKAKEKDGKKTPKTDDISTWQVMKMYFIKGNCLKKLLCKTAEDKEKEEKKKKDLEEIENVLLE